MSRRLFQALAAAFFFCAKWASADPRAEFANPIGEGADPWFIQYNGHYIGCFSEGGNGIALHESDRLEVLGPRQIAWTAPESGPASREVWAPELHPIHDRWYIYFAADDGENKNHRAWVLESAGADPLGPYQLHGPLYTGDDPKLSAENRWAIDLTVFELDKHLYAVWSGWPGTADVQYLYIAPMRDPLTMSAPRTLLCGNDTCLWERVDETAGSRGLNEGPEILQHDGRTFLAYSASASWRPSYKLGLLELKPGANPLDPKSWRKLPRPVFESTAETFGVGHNSFVKSPDGKEDWLVYHAKLERTDGWPRAIYAQPFTWSADGLPNFERPIAAGQLLPLPSGELVHSITGEHHFQFHDARDLAGWNYYGSHHAARVRNDALRLDDGRSREGRDFRSGEKLVVDGGNWTNCVLTAKFKMTDGRGQAGVLFRVRHPFLGQNGHSGYFAAIDADKMALVLGFNDGKSWHQLKSEPFSADFLAECRMKIAIRGQTVEVECNGKVLHAQDYAYASGSVGLRVVDSSAAFSELSVTPLP